MSHPTDDELVDLALGEPVDASRSAHVEECAVCSASVEQLRRTLRLTSGPLAYADWQAPDDAVWARVTAEIDAQPDAPVGAGPAPATMGGSDAGPDAGPAPTPPETSLLHDERPSGTDAPERPDRPDPSDRPASPTGPAATAGTAYAPEPVPADATVRPITAASARATRRRAAAWGAALVAASLVVGLLAGRAIWSPNESGSVSQVALKTLDTRQREGQASVVRAGDGLDLNVVTDRPLDAGDGYLEVWLINADGKRMVSVGVLRPGETGTFPISQALIDQGYVVVDISKEQFDDKPAHSGDSLLRGKLPA